MIDALVLGSIARFLCYYVAREGKKIKSLNHCVTGLQALLGSVGCGRSFSQPWARALRESFRRRRRFLTPTAVMRFISRRRCRAAPQLFLSRSTPLPSSPVPQRPRSSAACCLHFSSLSLRYSVLFFFVLCARSPPIDGPAQRSSNPG